MELSSLAKLQLSRTLLSLLCVFDVVISTLLFLRVADGRPKEHVKRQVLNFNFGVSSFDLWLLSLLRACLFFALAVVFCHNKMAVLRRTQQLAPACTAIIAVILCYTVAKLMASFEFYADGTSVHGTDSGSSNSTIGEIGLVPVDVLPCSPTSNSTDCELNLLSMSTPRHPYHPWLWSMIGCSFLCAVLYRVIYFTFTRIKLSFSVAGPGYRTKVYDTTKNIQSKEATPLLSNAGIAEEDPDSLQQASSVEQKKVPSTTELMWKLFGYAKPETHLYLIGFTFLIISSSAMAFIPYYTGQIINHIAITPSTAAFTQAILIMAGVSIVAAVGAGLRGSILTIAENKMIIRIREKLFQSLVWQEIAFFDKTEIGVLISRLTSDTTQVADQIGMNLNQFLRFVVQCVGSVVFMIQLSWKLSIVTLVIFPLIAITTWYFGEYFKKNRKAIQDAYSYANIIAEESLSSMRTVRSFATEDTEVKNYAERLLIAYNIHFKRAIIYGGWMWTSNLLALVQQVVTLYYGGHLVIYHEITGGDLVSFLLYQISLTTSINGVATIVTGLMEAIGAAEKVFELIDHEPTIKHNCGQQEPEKLDGVVEFRDVHFTYPTRPDTEVLKGVSFTAQPGEFVALVGPSGGGKSSCISLLERFYEPTSGDVLLDGQPLSKYSHSYLHSKISLVGQEPILYARSIASNIAYGVQDASVEEIHHSAELSNAHNFIVSMEDGYETLAGDKGVQLSGGQKQRVAIARALIRNPVVLLLDEATSALDAESEHLVQQAINRNLHGRTVIIIAHRLSTVESADKIVVINKGQVVEEGTHQELLQRNGMYANLVRKQMLSEESASSSMDHFHGDGEPVFFSREQQQLIHVSERNCSGSDESQRKMHSHGTSRKDYGTIN